MQVEWYGQSAFRLTDGTTTVFIDPFDDLSPLRARGLRWDYPDIARVDADLLLVTHEHLDHNGADAIGGEPVTLRSTAGLSTRQSARCSRSPPSTTTSPAPNAVLTRCSPSRSAGGASLT